MASMRYVNAEPARRDVYIWSPGSVALNRAYHKIWGWVKRNAPTATSWGRGRIYGIAEMTICKVAYEFRRSLLSNDSPKRTALRGTPLATHSTRLPVRSSVFAFHPHGASRRCHPAAELPTWAAHWNSGYTPLIDSRPRASRQRPQVCLRLLQPEAHIHLAIHRGAGAEVISGLRPVTHSPVQLAKAEIAMSYERAHAEF
jgi:hypothetical protein